MIRLHGYWRSTASYRIRIALALKGLEFEQIAHDLRIGAQRAPEFLSLNPQGLVPAIEDDGFVLTQSVAILEWLDECYPEPPLLPEDVAARAATRAMVGIVACDIHPLNNLRVLSALRTEFAASEAAIGAWIARWIHEGFEALEVMVQRHGGAFAFGDEPSIADCCLVPQVYAARRFGVPLSNYPAIRACADRCNKLAAFAAADPANQPDADPELQRNK